MKPFIAFLSGVAITLFAGAITINTLAASGKLTLAVDPINIQVNGEVFEPKSADGSDALVFAYSGVTYAPLRAMAETFGLEVGYDKNSNMATVTDPDDQNNNKYEYNAVSVKVNGEIINDSDIPYSIQSYGIVYFPYSIICEKLGIDKNEYSYENAPSVVSGRNDPIKYMGDVYLSAVTLSETLPIETPTYNMDEKMIEFVLRDNKQ